MIKRLAQVTNEDKYARGNMNSVLLKDLDSTVGTFREQFTSSLIDYMLGSYYDSKQVRVKHLAERNLFDLVDEILVVVIALEGNETLQSVVGKIACKLRYEDIFDAAKTAGEIVGLLTALDILDVIKGVTIMVKSNVVVTIETREKIAGMMYLPPLLCRPKEVTHNHESGYLTVDKSVVLSGYSHNKKQVLEVLNTCNGVELALDTAMLNFNEEPGFDGDDRDKIRNFERMVSESNGVYMELLLNDNSFYMDHRFDSRGRLYCSGYHVTYQGSEYKRSLINLNKKELIV